MMHCQSIIQILRTIWVRCISPSLGSKTRQRAIPLLPILGLTSVDREGRATAHKRDDFNFHIINFLLLSCNIPSSPAYSVFFSQLIRYAGACSSYNCFILRVARLSYKLLVQGYVRRHLKCLSGISMVDMGISWLWSLPCQNITWHSGTRAYTVTPSIDQTFY